MAIQVIRATKPLTAKHDSAEKLRVAAYCRVSTEAEEQESSYEAQCSHYTSYIRSNPDWLLAGIFADEGISGTSTKGRTQFNTMIAACESGAIDMVITKSISRFARNTLDCLTYIRKLKELGIPIYFEKENINTMDAKGELLLTIMASIAQQESQSISQNVRMGIQYRMQEGKGRLDTTRFLGLTKQDGKLVIVPQEAEIVRRIYREYLEGFSPEAIAKRLEAEGVATPTGGEVWYASTVAHILANEKYAGDCLLQKYYTVDFLSHKIAKNAGQLPQYYVEDDHEPIVPKPVFYQVRGELLRRAALKYKPSAIRYGSLIALSGRLVCGKCGRTLKRFTKQDGRETDWRCRRRAGCQKENRRDVKSACGCRFVPESEARRAVMAAFNRLPGHREALAQARAQINDVEIRRIDALLAPSFVEQLDALTDEQTSLLLQRADLCLRETYLRFLLELIDEMERKRLRRPEPIDTFSPACHDRDEFFRRTRIPLPEGILDAEGRITRFDNAMVVRFLENMTVTDDGFDVRFKAGVTIHV